MLRCEYIISENSRIVYMHNKWDDTVATNKCLKSVEKPHTYK